MLLATRPAADRRDHRLGRAAGRLDGGDGYRGAYETTEVVQAVRVAGGRPCGRSSAGAPENALGRWSSEPSKRSCRPFSTGLAPLCAGGCVAGTGCRQCEALRAIRRLSRRLRWRHPDLGAQAAAQRVRQPTAALPAERRAVLEMRDYRIRPAGREILLRGSSFKVKAKVPVPGRFHGGQGARPSRPTSRGDRPIFHRKRPGRRLGADPPPAEDGERPGLRGLLRGQGRS